MNIYIDRGEAVDWESLTDEERELFNDCFTRNAHKKKSIVKYWEEYEEVDEGVEGD